MHWLFRAPQPGSASTHFTDWFYISDPAFLQVDLLVCWTDCIRAIVLLYMHDHRSEQPNRTSRQTQTGVSHMYIQQSAQAVPQSPALVSVDGDAIR